MIRKIYKGTISEVCAQIKADVEFYKGFTVEQALRCEMHEKRVREMFNQETMLKGLKNERS